MSTADTIYELVKTLPEDQANLVLVFAEFVRQRAQPGAAGAAQSFNDFFGILKDSPNFDDDPVTIQRTMRSEWD
ncbi:DUF2281 domain-containing protein [Sphaerothrix gracilis]|uniref:DUF2281 domain-containing protein n=1 Tax=Sphaerothrix gracilis TaxID=3151835 RepID=UPI0031FDD73C